MLGVETKFMVPFWPKPDLRLWNWALGLEYSVSKKMGLGFCLNTLALIKLVQPTQIILKTDVHTQILHTETFLTEAFKLRYRVSNLKLKK
jgi:hypothetical protein